MSLFGDNKTDKMLCDAFLLINEKNQIICRQEKDIGSLKREIATIKKELSCFQREKE